MGLLILEAEGLRKICFISVSGEGEQDKSQPQSEKRSQQNDLAFYLCTSVCPCQNLVLVPIPILSQCFEQFCLVEQKYVKTNCLRWGIGAGMGKYTYIGLYMR